MRILVITNEFPAVSQTFVTLHCDSLLSQGHDVTIMAAAGAKRDPAQPSSLDERVGKHLITIARPGGGHTRKAIALLKLMPRNWRALRLVREMAADYLRGKRAGRVLAAIPYAAACQNSGEWDVVHVHFGSVALPIAQLYEAGFLHAPLVVTFHGWDLNAKRRLPNQKLYARVFRTAQFFTVGTNFMAQHLLECGVSPDRFKVVPMGIDLSMFPPRTARQTGELGPRLATVGRLVEVKGTEFAIRAVAELKRMWPNIILHVVGDGPLRRELETLAARLDVRDRVVFHGPLSHSETIRVLANADIYMHPGIVAADETVEGQGVALAEAQALRLPIVASSVGGIPEVVRDGETAYLVGPGDVAALSDRIAVLATDQSLRTQMGNAGRAFVEARFDQRRLVNEWLEIYEHVVKSSRRPAG